MAVECFPGVTRCFSGKTFRVSSKRSDKSNSQRSPPPLNTSTTGSSIGSTSTSCHSQPRRLSRDEELTREVFRHFDGDDDGKISAAELREYFASIGEYLSYEDAEGVIADLDSDGDRMLDFKDFLRMMEDSSDNSKIGREGEEDEDLRKVFEMFEHEKGSGRITPRGLQRMLGRLGDSKTYDECAAMIQMYDIDGDGQLDFHEFHQMMS